MRVLNHKLKSVISAINIADRDAIPERLRTEGLVFVYVESEQTIYYLAGGITNAHWVAIGGSSALNIRHVSTDFVFDASDDIVLFDTVLNTYINATLITAVGNEGKIIRCKNNGIGHISIELNGTETLDGESVSVRFDTPMTNFTLVSDGANWFTIS
jgi:hypothetical protein